MWAILWQPPCASPRPIGPPRWRATPIGSATAEHHLLTWGDADYPSDLLNIPDPPLLLWVQGSRTALSHALRLAIVGSRNPTPQGQRHALDFAQALGLAGVCVVSGLALGVDAAAHEGALLAKAPTLAVVGTGLDRVYPRRHADLAQAYLSTVAGRSSANTPWARHPCHTTSRGATASFRACPKRCWWCKRRCVRAL